MSLLATSAIVMYGRKVDGVQLTAPTSGGPGNDLLFKQLSASGAALAWIFAFSYEGHYYDLPKPAIFLVHGNGTNVNDGVPAGVAGSAVTMGPDVRVWTYDKNDLSIRLDVETGTLADILLEEATKPDAGKGVHLGGSRLHLRGSGH
jgi:hypothetical protein